MEDIEYAWSKFRDEGFNDEIINIEPTITNSELNVTVKGLIPKCSPLNISTKTKIAYLNTPIDLKEVFWEVPVIPYAKPVNGVIKVDTEDQEEGGVV